MVPPWGHMAGKDRKTLLLSLHGKAQTLSTCSGPSVTCTVPPCTMHLGSLLMSVTLHWETNPPNPTATLSCKALSSNHWSCLRSRGPVSEEELPSQVAWIWAVLEAETDTADTD